MVLKRKKMMLQEVIVFGQNPKEGLEKLLDGNWLFQDKIERI